MCAPQKVEMPGGKSVIMTRAILRGDFAPITIHRWPSPPAHLLLLTIMNFNRFCFIGENSILRPPFNPKTSTFIQMHIGKYTSIGHDSVIESAYIGTGCTIGNHCVISQRVIIKDYVTVEDHTVIPPDMVLPPFSIVAGNPARIIGENPESITTTAQFTAKTRFHQFKPLEQEQAQGQGRERKEPNTAHPVH
jgi:dynactin 5